VAGAVVIATDEDGERGRATTGADGVARLATLAAGEYTVRVEADRFVDEEKEVSVEEGEPATVSVALSPGVPFDGTVLDDETGKPLGGATIAVEARGSVGGFTSAEFRAPYARAQSDAEGRFHVRGVPEGKVATVEAAAQGYASGAFSLRILGGQVTRAVVVVWCAAARFAASYAPASRSRRDRLRGGARGVPPSWDRIPAAGASPRRGARAGDGGKRPGRQLPGRRAPPRRHVRRGGRGGGLREVVRSPGSP
jgi:hypothetical protein